ncbi:MAG: MlaD family protein [Tannerellaceae bacterium]|jgi:phospholipid/cholesterol/gamma-HCH transport system substrate-binding protein|nr:MlaD family protein [Tannerellaceae bacterium]
MMKKKFTNEAKIGIMTIISIALLYMGINYLKGINLFHPSNRYYISFDKVDDVTISSPVFVDGFKVGLVRAITYDYSGNNGIQVEIRLDDNMKINKNSYAVIEKNLLGGAKLHLRLNKYNNEYMKSGETMEGRMSSDMMSSVQNDLLPVFTNLMVKIDSVLTGLQTLITNPALTRTLEHLENTTAELESSSFQLNRMLNKDFPLILSDFKTISGNFVQVSDELKALDLQLTINSLNTTLANIKQTTEQLNSEENSLGLLLNDKALYNNMNGVMDNASKLLIDLKEHPKRYVHFSLF